MGAPQIIVIVMFALQLSLNATKDHEPLPEPHVYHFGKACFRVAVWAGLLWWGGFFS
jgi:hypothetical protein